MLSKPNALRWDRAPGHYEVYYLTLTDLSTGIGIWIRYTMIAPLRAVDEPASAALWFLAMDPRPGGGVFGRKASFPISELSATSDPFSLRIGAASLADGSMSGAFEDVAWNLHWRPGRAYEHVHPLLRATRIAKSILVLPHADIAVQGNVTFADETLELRGARGGQAHLWGSKHASSWAWVHCNGFRTLDGAPVTDTFLDGVSVVASRLGREAGPNTAVVCRIGGSDFRSTSPLRVLTNSSTFALTGGHFEAVDGARRLIAEVDADRGQLAGVTYRDPDGELAYCYNSETASMRLHLFERARRVGGWAHRITLVAPGCAHFEYAQRAPVPDLDLLTT